MTVKTYGFAVTAGENGEGMPTGAWCPGMSAANGRQCLHDFVEQCYNICNLESISVNTASIVSGHSTRTE